MKNRIRLINKTSGIKQTEIEFIGKLINLSENVWNDEDGNLLVLDEYDSAKPKELEKLMEDLYGKYILLIQRGPYSCIAIGEYLVEQNMGGYLGVILKKGFQIQGSLTGVNEIFGCEMFYINENVTEILEISEEEYEKIKENIGLEINYSYGN